MRVDKPASNNPKALGTGFDALLSHTAQPNGTAAPGVYRAHHDASSPLYATHWGVRDNDYQMP